MNERNGGKNKVIRGKTRADTIPAMQESEPGVVSGSREEAAHSSGRPGRISMSNMKKLEIPESLKEEGYYYRFFQDRDGRLAQAKAAYYEHVTDEQGNNFTRPSGPYTMYAMRLKQEYRDQDLALKKARVQATLEAEAGIGANEYAPDSKTGRAEGGTSAISHT